MTFQLPDGYRRLLPRYRVRVPAGSTVTEEGAVPDRFFVVLGGRLALYAQDAGGRRSIVREAGPGESVGLAAALNGRPLFAGARAVETSELLAIPVGEAVEVFAAAPELALALLRELASGRGELLGEVPRPPVAAPGAGEQEPGGAPGAGEQKRGGAPTAGEQKRGGAPGAGEQKRGGTPGAGEQKRGGAPTAEEESGAGALPTTVPAGLVRLEGSFDEATFFVAETECPVSGTHFQHLRTRAGAMRPTGRDSDFRISYRAVDPTHYSVIVCPGCSFAAYANDFAELAPPEQSALLDAQAQRDVFGRPNLCGERTLEGAVLSLTLARHCYEARDSGPRLRAGLLHRQAWLERERGQYEAERRLLRDARAAYIEAFERDRDLSEAATVRATYVIGDLSLRLDDPREAGRWFETCLRMPELTAQKGLEVMARDRLSEAHELLRQLDQAS